MADKQNISEATDLIDVSDIADEFDESTLRENNFDDFSTPLSNDNLNQAPQKAILFPLKQRFAAFCFDTSLLYACYWIAAIIYRGIALGNSAGPVPAYGKHGIIFHALFALLTLIGHVLFEGIFSATPGKLLCGLKIRSLDGRTPGFGAVFVRNLMRPIDIVFTALYFGLLLLEKSRFHQRLGDRLAGTVVIATNKHRSAIYSVDYENIASASGRIIAGIIDLVILGIFSYGYLLLLTPESPVASMLLVLFFPLILTSFVICCEVSTHSSLGKFILGYILCHEDGSTVAVSSSLLRTFYKIIDILPFGLLSIIVSKRKQRSGDLAADTIVIKHPRHIRAAIGSALSLFLALAFLSAGIENPYNYHSPGFEVNFLPAFEFKKSLHERRQEALAAKLRLKDFIFKTSEFDRPRNPPIFKAGEDVYMFFKVEGYGHKRKTVRLQEDLIVRSPKNDVSLRLENAIDFHEQLAELGPIELANNISLPDNAKPGRYTVTIIIRDLQDNKQLQEQRFFYVSSKK